MDEWSPRINIKYNKEMLRKKKSKTLTGIKPTTFQIPVGCSNHWAMGDSYGEQVIGFYFVEVAWVGGWVGG